MSVLKSWKSTTARPSSTATVRIMSPVSEEKKEVRPISDSAGVGPWTRAMRACSNRISGAGSTSSGPRGMETGRRTCTGSSPR